ncbi:MAG: hemerythrin domain-containing protein [Armatimonadetes bacterium]|nr:hemerythrin domain-containing protein [Armatimonadota bacterium]
MNIIDVLLIEHGTFYLQFEHLEQTAPAIEQLGELQSKVSMLAAVLPTHARLEDELLFTALEPHLGTMGGPLFVMRMEHDQLEGLLGQLPQLEDLDQAKDMLAEAITVARQHFGKEEQILFAIARQSLDADTLNRLGGEFAARRGVASSHGGIAPCGTPGRLPNQQESRGNR